MDLQTSSPASIPTLPPRLQRDIYCPTHVPPHLIPEPTLREGYAYSTLEKPVYIHLQCLGLIPSGFPPLSLEELTFAAYLVLLFHWYQQQKSISETLVNVFRPELEVSLKFHKRMEAQLHLCFQNAFPNSFSYFLLECIHRPSAASSSMSSSTALLTSLLHRMLGHLPKDGETVDFQTFHTCPSATHTLPLHLLMDLYVQLLMVTLPLTSSTTTRFPEETCFASLLPTDLVQVAHALAYFNLYLKTADPLWFVKCCDHAVPHPHLHLSLRWHVHWTGWTHPMCMTLAHRSHPHHLRMDFVDLIPPPPFPNEEASEDLLPYAKWAQAWEHHLLKLSTLKKHLGDVNLWEKCISPSSNALENVCKKVGTFSLTSEWLDLIQKLVNLEMNLNAFGESACPEFKKIDFDLNSTFADTAYTWLYSQRHFLIQLIDRLTLSPEDPWIEDCFPPFTESILTLFQAFHTVLKAVHRFPLPLLRDHLVLKYMALIEVSLTYYFQKSALESQKCNADYALQQYHKLRDVAKKESKFNWAFLGERTICMLQEIAAQDENNVIT